MRRFALATAALLLGAVPVLAQTTPKRVRGTIESLAGDTLTVEANSGEKVTIALASDYTVGAIEPTTLDKVKPGSGIGIVGFGPPQQQRAAVISLFPPGAKVNEAQFPWDSQPGSTMTNAPVVAEVDGNDGRVLTVTVKGEPVQVTVPPNAVIQQSAPGERGMLVPGAKVIIFAQKEADGTVTAARINVGKDGFSPAS